jgi:hypothetical protein
MKVIGQKFNNRCASAGLIDLRTQIFDIFEMKKSVVNLTLSDNHLCRHHNTRQLLPRPAVHKMMKLTKVMLSLTSLRILLPPARLMNQHRTHLKYLF